MAKTTKSTKTTKCAKTAKTTKTAKTASAAKTTQSVKAKKAAKAKQAAGGNAPKRTTVCVIKSDKKYSTWGYAWRLIVSLAIPLAVGGLSAAIAGDAMSSFAEFNQPPLAPPAWLLPVAWTALYLLMGLAAFLIWVRPEEKIAAAKTKRTFFMVYGLQLIFNFFWSIFFFNGEWYFFAFIWLLALWAMILAMVVWSHKAKCHGSMWALLPYLLWVTFAGYLNIMIAILN